MIVLRENVIPYYILSTILTFGKCMFSLFFRFVVFIVTPTTSQKTNNFYILASFNHSFSIWISFLDTKKKIIPVQLQKVTSYLDYKMIVEFDCALITVSSGGLFKSMLRQYYSN